MGIELDRITDFDLIEAQTRLDRVSHLVSDDMIAADRAERLLAFAPLPADDVA